MKLPMALALFGLAGAACAQDAPQAGPSDEIVVTGARPSTLDLKRLEGAVRVYQAGRSEFAPASSLWFQLRPKDGQPLAGMTLTLRRGTGPDATEIDVPVDGEGRFQLAELPPGDWELLHNRGKGRIAVRALVLSPGTDEGDRLLGDLRLQCRVGWEVQKGAMSFVQRAGFATLGGCASKSIMFHFGTVRSVVAARVTDGTRSDALPLGRSGHDYAPPLGDRTLPNAARVRVDFAPA